MNAKIYRRLLLKLFKSRDDENITLDHSVFPEDETKIEIPKNSSLTSYFLETYEYCNGFNVSWEATKIEQATGM